MIFSALWNIILGIAGGIISSVIVSRVFLLQSKFQNCLDSLEFGLGKINYALVIYIEHLYTYLSQLMSEIVYYIANKGAKSVDEAYATILENYRTYMELINNGILGVPDVLPNGIIEFN